MSIINSNLNKEMTDDDIQIKIELFNISLKNKLKLQKNEDSFKAIRDLGPACDIEGGFSGVIHLLSKYDNLKDMIINNAKAGGDSSARAMIAAIIFVASKDISELPKEWLKINAEI